MSPNLHCFANCFRRHNTDLWIHHVLVLTIKIGACHIVRFSVVEPWFLPFASDIRIDLSLFLQSIPMIVFRVTVWMFWSFLSRLTGIRSSNHVSLNACQPCSTFPDSTLYVWYLLYAKLLSWDEQLRLLHYSNVCYRCPLLVSLWYVRVVTLGLHCRLLTSTDWRIRPDYIRSPWYVLHWRNNVHRESLKELPVLVYCFGVHCKVSISKLSYAQGYLVHKKMALVTVDAAHNHCKVVGRQYYRWL